MRVPSPVESTRWLPSASTSAKLFGVGATIGPVVDSLHNQVLLRYNIAPITIDWPSSWAGTSDSTLIATTASHFFCSSWTVPPLLGVAYIVLGGILPRLFQKGINAVSPSLTDQPSVDDSQNESTLERTLRWKAILAVLSTAAIIQLSDFWTTHPDATRAVLGTLIEQPAEQHILALLLLAVLQWAALDGTLAALLVASITSIGGPLSELPLVAANVWTYLPSAADYTPLLNIEWPLLASLLGDDYATLALSSITGPCYFAVTMDAIALARWFDVNARVEISKDR
jgi:hypothetical protein